MLARAVITRRLPCRGEDSLGEHPRQDVDGGDSGFGIDPVPWGGGWLGLVEKRQGQLHASSPPRWQPAPPPPAGQGARGKPSPWRRPATARRGGREYRGAPRPTLGRVRNEC